MLFPPRVTDATTAMIFEQQPTAFLSARYRCESLVLNLALAAFALATIFLPSRTKNIEAKSTVFYSPLLKGPLNQSRCAVMLKFERMLESGSTELPL